MYKIKRYNMLNDLELLGTERLEKNMADKFANEVYFSLIELIVAALNDESYDPITDKPLTLIDRVDKQFKERKFHDYIRLIAFDYTVQLAETVRLHFIAMGCPRYVKYEAEFSAYHFLAAMDYVKIDFAATSIAFLEKEAGVVFEVDDDEDVATDNPSLELLNKHYDTEDK